MDASHLIIGLAGFSLTAETYLVHDVAINYPLCFLVGCATVVFYGIHRLVQIAKYSAVASTRMEFLAEYRTVIISFVVGCAIVCLALVILFFLKWWLMWIVILPLSSFYLFPLLRNQQRIRDLPYLKLWAIASIWSLVTIGLPWLISDVDSIISPFLLVEHFLFFLLITIPFDIRDRSEDHALGIKTFATNLSGKRLNQFGLIVFLLLSLLIWIAPIPFNYSVVLQCVSIVALVLLFNAKEGRPLWYYSFLLDGLIIARLLFVLL